MNKSPTQRLGLLAGVTLIAIIPYCDARAASPESAESLNAVPDQAQEVVVSAPKTHAELEMGGDEVKKILPGTSPMQAIEFMPGVIYENADPWGNSENNQSLYVHGFSLQQLGYTLDGVPLGDQSFGNYNGLSPQRAIISENIGRVALSSGSGDLGTASTSNLGGTLAVFTSDPKAVFGAALAQSVGSYDALRTYARLDTGALGGNNSAYISFDRQDARAWDYDAHQGGYQVNGKFVHEDGDGKLTAYFDWDNKNEPSEDAVNHTAAGGAPYIRAPFFPNFAAAKAYLNASGLPPSSAGSNYSNYFSDNQRTDYLGYVKYDDYVNEALTWSNQIYYHHDGGIGLVATPLGETTVGSKNLLSFYYPGQNLIQVTGGSGFVTRGTSYTIDREGIESTAVYTLGTHEIELGGWFEHNQTSNSRLWFPVNANDPLSPYAYPTNSLFTQAQLQLDNKVVQTHLQDNWHILPELALQAGFKTSLQFADGTVPVQPVAGSYSGASGNLPSGEIDTKEAFLPQIGLLWDLDSKNQIFANVQKNMQQYVTYGLSAGSPWALGSQSAFNLFKQNGHPQTSWTYDLGWRGNQAVNSTFLTGLDGQINFYHVDFANRLLSISPNSVISAVVGGVSILDNVGGVSTNGIDLAETLHFGPHVSLYDALSYNHSTYDANYVSGTTTIPTSGKIVPGDPSWMNKLILSATWGGFDAQLTGQYVGRRYATYTDDLSVSPYRIYGLELGYDMGDLLVGQALKDLKLQLNVTNLTNERGISTLSVGAASGTYSGYAMAPRQVFLTLSSSL